MIPMSGWIYVFVPHRTLAQFPPIDMITRLNRIIVEAGRKILCSCNTKSKTTPFQDSGWTGTNRAMRFAVVYRFVLKFATHCQ
ncbi:hypothetical protein B0H63DRAFT_478288 [Podospora didyma]|uniref:Uncharacterized protein n=1 Tax=Podospora didyma TaxID=330526 RepID=A0AAE0NC44_9PEZI|nr:hypothetical protein B0H63DRAFT_478288 [Podospora didyma]